MRFSVDAHTVGQHLTGNEVYIRNLLQNFAAIDETAEFVAYVSDTNAARTLPARFKKRLVSRNPFQRLGWDLTRAMYADKPDLLHVQYTAPLWCPVPLVVSVHDVSYLDHPSFFTPARRQQLMITVRRTVRRAAQVLCPSEFSRRAILAAYQLPPERVSVMPNACSPLFRPIVREVASAAIRSKFGLPPVPFILSVGDLQPRKNHLGLIRAFGDLLQSTAVPHHLLLVGKDTWFSPIIREAVAKSGIGDRIHFTGFVDDMDLVNLYGASDVCIYPSFYEGFGLPILEAMACGRAVACSNTTAMPEVAHAAALLFDPHAPSEMTRAMRDLLLNPELRARMERLGLQRAGHFSWERTAQRTLDVYYQVAGQPRPTPARTFQLPVSR